MLSLLTENGPNAGHRYELAAPKMIVGRHPDCDVVVDVGAVSRHHAQLLLIGDHYYVEDLNSRNGTFVNSTPVKDRHRLQEGDRIQVCDITFRFGEKATAPMMDGGSDQSGSVLLEDRPADNSIVLSRVEVLSSNGSSIAVVASADAKLRALMEISRSLSRTLSLDEVLPQLLESLFRLFAQADRGFIILRNQAGELIPRWTKLRRGDDDSMIRLSRTILNQVVETQQAILSHDTSDDDRFQLSESIADFRIRSFICAPLVDVEGHVLGAIQLDSLDHRNKFRDEDLELLASVAGQAGIAVDNSQLHEQVVRQLVLQRDLELAQQVQQGFLPQRAPEIEQFRFHHDYQPADLVGGDYYDYILLPDGRVAIVLADVVGHGMAAALQTAQLSAALQFSLATNSDPSAAIRELNRKLSKNSLPDRLITLLMVVVSPDRDKISVVNAGHMPPLLCRGSEDPVEIATESQGIPLLVMDAFPYEVAEETLEPGDRIVMYTDGLHESMNPDREIYGRERLKQQIKGIVDGAELIERVLDDIRTFASGVPPEDDMCVLCCTRV